MALEPVAAAPKPVKPAKKDPGPFYSGPFFWSSWPLSPMSILAIALAISGPCTMICKAFYDKLVHGIPIEPNSISRSVQQPLAAAKERREAKANAERTSATKPAAAAALSAAAILSSSAPAAAAAVPSRERPKADMHGPCGSWTDMGECEKNPGFMRSECATSCGRRPQDVLPAAECEVLASRGDCRSKLGASECAFTCLAWLQRTTTPDKQGNCWYWATDGECAANPVWMNETCSRACGLLHWCEVEPWSAACMERFECPPTKDEGAACPERALRGECRAPREDVWGSTHVALRCQASCHLLDPPSVSHAVMRPMVRRNGLVDGAPHPRHGSGSAIYRRHSPTHCPLGKATVHALLGGVCPNQRLHPAHAVPWARHRLRCPHNALAMTPRLTWPPPRTASSSSSSSTSTAAASSVGAALDAPDALDAATAAAASPLSPPRGIATLPPELRARAAGVVVQHVWESPRVRLLHNMISAEDAEAIIESAQPRYHRSSTARAGSDESRTSRSAMLPNDSPAVASLRQLIAYFAGYPEHNLEPLQAVRYEPGEFYRPHHDYYNACETWMDGNRHFTFLVYLNTVEGAGGETRFPRLNLTVPTHAYSALLFNNCLDNGEPDERSQHEGVAPVSGVKYAINGWMRAKNLRKARGVHGSFME